MNEEQEKNVNGFTGDIKKFLRQKDFTSAIIFVNDLKKYILELKKSE